MLSVYEKHSRRKLIATILSIVVVAGCVVFADAIKSKSTAQTTTVSQSRTATTPTTTTAANSVPTTSTNTSSTSSVTGSFSASTSYYVPHSNETIQVSLTLKDGVITEASIQNSEGDNESARYQQDFASAYKSYVIGQKIAGLKIGIIAGASDTTQGFNDALAQIASKAQA